MDKDLDTTVAIETSRLLAELDDVLGQCSIMRDIVDKYEHLHSIESVVGPSSKTQILREEIALMERELGFERCQ